MLPRAQSTTPGGTAPFSPEIRLSISAEHQGENRTNELSSMFRFPSYKIGLPPCPFLFLSGECRLCLCGAIRLQESSKAVALLNTLHSAAYACKSLKPLENAASDPVAEEAQNSHFQTVY